MDATRRSLLRHRRVRDAQLRRLRRVTIRIQYLRHQVERDSQCIDVFIQMSATVAATAAFMLSLLEKHLRRRVAIEPPGGAHSMAEAGCATPLGDCLPRPRRLRS